MNWVYEGTWRSWGPGEATAFGHIFAAMKFDKAGVFKKDIFASERLRVGLLCFEPGQGQAGHAHAGSDKVYLVHEGTATITVGGETLELGAGACAHAPAGEAHEIWNRGRDRLVVVVIVAPPEPAHGAPAGASGGAPG